MTREEIAVGLYTPAGMRRLARLDESTGWDLPALRRFGASLSNGSIKPLNLGGIHQVSTSSKQISRISTFTPAQSSSQPIGISDDGAL